MGQLYHPRELLAQRRRSQEQKLFQCFITLSSKAGDYYQQLKHKRLNHRVHVRKIMGLSEIYGIQATARAMQDAFQYEAFSSEYIANLLEPQTKTVWFRQACLNTHKNIVILHNQQSEKSSGHIRLFLL